MTRTCYKHVTREMLEAHAPANWQVPQWPPAQASPHVLPTPLGDLQTMPHLLVAGASGSGKSVFLREVLRDLMAACTPSELQMYIIDPKYVEFPEMTRSLHVRDVVNESDAALEMLQWLCDEMDARFYSMSLYRARSLAELNDARADIPALQLPYLVLLIDEYADLLSVGRKTLEPLIQRLAQKARAAGIHLILSTQRPDASIITPAIRANFPTRVCFRVASVHDSRVVLGTAGAENLPGRGAWLASDGRSGQGEYVTLEDTEAGIDYWYD